jgi:hypothetical protein
MSVEGILVRTLATQLHENDWMIEHVEVPIVKGRREGTVVDLEAAKPKSLIQWDGYVAAERSCDTVDEKLLVVCQSKLHVRPYHIDDIVTRRITMNNYMESIRRGVDAVNDIAIEQRKVLLKFADRKIVCAIGGPVHDAEVRFQAAKHSIIFVDWTTPPSKVHRLQNAIDSASRSSSSEIKEI